MALDRQLYSNNLGINVGYIGFFPPNDTCAATMKIDGAPNTTIYCEMKKNPSGNKVFLMENEKSFEITDRETSELFQHLMLVGEGFVMHNAEFIRSLIAKNGNAGRQKCYLVTKQYKETVEQVPQFLSSLIRYKEAMAPIERDVGEIVARQNELWDIAKENYPGDEKAKQN